MGIDYSSVGGIGVELTDEFVKAMIVKGVFTTDEWEADRCECMDQLGLTYSEGGNSYSGDTYYYWLVEGETLGDVNKNAPAFVQYLKGLGIDVSEADLSVISDYLVW